MSSSPDEPPSEAEGAGADSPEDAAFEAELRAEIQADVEGRLAEVDARDADSGPEADAEQEQDPWDQGDDPEGEGPVVMRPFPGMGGHNAIVGGGNLIAAFQEEVDPGAGYLVGELPGETLLVVEGPRPNGSRHFTLLLAAGLCFSPCIAMGAGLDKLLPPTQERIFFATVIGLTLVGLGLSAYLLNRAFYDPGRGVCTSEGLGIESGSVAAWIPWSEVLSYERDGEVITVNSEQGEFSLTATEEEAGVFLDLLDHRGIHRGPLSTAPPQATEGAQPPPG